MSLLSHNRAGVCSVINWLPNKILCRVRVNVYYSLLVTAEQTLYNISKDCCKIHYKAHFTLFFKGFN